MWCPPGPALPSPWRPWDELRKGCVRYASRQDATMGPWVTELHQVPCELHQVPGVVATATLLTSIWRRSSPIKRVFLYLHGFPDQSLDHREEIPESYGSLRPQLPRRLGEKILSTRDESAFVAFNFSGIPGSDKTVSFYEKTVDQEVLDAMSVIQYLRSIHGDVPVHVLGISTGAIVASLLRGKAVPQVTITAIAGLVDVEKGLRYDFDDTQLASFDAQGWCWKEFWLPPDSSSNPPEVVMDAERGISESEPETWIKCHLPLAAAYRESCLALDLQGAVGRGVDGQSPSPMLILHGDRDRSVPLENGEALFQSAAEPKELMIIKGGDHLLRRSKTANKAATAILNFVSKWENSLH